MVKPSPTATALTAAESDGLDRVARHLRERLILAAAGRAGAEPQNRMGELVVIDGHVPAAALLERGVLAGIRSVIVPRSDDGLHVLARAIQALAAVQPVRAVHIMALGAPGRVRLGSTALSADLVPLYRDVFATIADAVKPTGGVALYASAAAQGPAGQALIEALETAFGRPVVAATGPVGCPWLGGSWQLDHRSARARASGWLVPSVLTAAGEHRYDELLSLIDPPALASWSFSSSRPAA